MTPDLELSLLKFIDIISELAKKITEVVDEEQEQQRHLP